MHDTELHLEADRATAAKDALELCLYQVSHQVAKAIQKVVVVAGPEAYPSWPAYAAAFAERGGVIEACASGKVTGLFEQRPCCAVLCSAVLTLLCLAMLS